jgi:hypothetical protein
MYILARNNTSELIPPITPIPSSIVTNTLKRFLVKYLEIYEPNPSAAIYRPIVIEYCSVLLPKR